MVMVVQELLKMDFWFCYDKIAAYKMLHVDKNEY